jgi:hypothetical protein
VVDFKVRWALDGNIVIGKAFERVHVARSIVILSDLLCHHH